jgi:hypothetical protein
MSDVNLLYSNGDERQLAKEFFVNTNVDLKKKNSFFYSF